MAEHELEIREVLPDAGVPDGERLEESAALEVGTFALAGGSFGVAAAQAYYSRASHLLQRTELERDRAEFEAQMDADRRALEVENRVLRAQLYGLEGLDAYDRGESPPVYDLTLDDEPFDFGVE